MKKINLSAVLILQKNLPAYLTKGLKLLSAIFIFIMAFSGITHAQNAFYDFEDGSIPSSFHFQNSGTFGGSYTISNIWYLEQSSNTYNGGFSIRSGSITHQQASNASIMVDIGSEGGSLQFKYRTSTESGFDFLRILVNGSEVGIFSGSLSWRDSPVYNLPSGSYSIELWYTKDGSQNDPNGIEAVFIDDISITDNTSSSSELTITELAPNSAAPGTDIEIYGSGFSATASENSVTFDGTSANVVSAFPNKLVVTVPDIDPGFHDISVTNTLGTADYAGKFSVLAERQAFLTLTESTLDSLAGSNADLADVDSDGDLDLFMTGFNSSGSRKLYLNDGSGSFTDSGENLPLGKPTFGDANGDGNIDIIITELMGTEGYETKLFLNNGSGNFSDSGINFMGIIQGTGIFADVNGDGALDIFITGETGVEQSDSRLYMNDGSGGFTDSGINFGISTHFTGTGAAFADIDNDADLDLLIMGYLDNTFDRATGIYLNDGAGNFSNSGASLEAISGRSLNFADFDGDGDQDFFVMGHTDTTITRLYLNNGSGSFTDSGNSFEELSPMASAIGDLDGDGDLDILITGNSNESPATKFYENDGTGTFTEVDYALENLAEGFAEFGDLNGDGSLDLIISGFNSTDEAVTNLYLNNDYPPSPDVAITDIHPKAAAPGTEITLYGKGFNPTDLLNSVRFDTAEVTVLSVASSGNKMVVEIPAMSSGPASISIENNNGTAEYAGILNILVPKSVSFEDAGEGLSIAAASSSSFGDVNGDTYQDLLISGIGQTGSSFSWLYINDGTGSFSNSGISIEGGNYGHSELIDLNGDGSLDLFKMGASSSNQYDIKTYTNDGYGNFTSYESEITPVYGSSVSFADVDADGDLDVFISGRNSTNQRVSSLYLNNGIGIFTDSGQEFTGVVYGSSDFGDVDGDGSPDLIMTGIDNSGIQTSALYLNNGSGDFSDSGQSYEGVGYSTSEFDDVNGDRHLDLIITGENSALESITTLYINDGNGVFTTSGASFEGVSYSSTEFGDVDGDGYSDLLITGENTGGTRISTLYLNDGTGSFTDSGISLPGVFIGHTSLGDVDNDGDLDLVLTGQGNDNQRYATLYENTGGRVTVSGMYPDSGIPNTKVSILGANFSDTNSENNVLFGSEAATIVSSSATKLVIEVPATEPGFTEISVTSTLGSDTLSSSFNVLTEKQTYFELSSTTLLATQDGHKSFEDIDKDGDLDLLLTGVDLSGQRITRLYLNDAAGNYTDSQQTLENVAYSSSDFGDVDNDGDADLILTGLNNSGVRVTYLYLNAGDGVYTDSGISFPGIYYGTVDFSDINNDGHLDLLITGSSLNGVISRVYVNDGLGDFSEVSTPFVGVYYSSLSVGDVDNDGDQDVVITGRNASEVGTSKLYLNDGSGTFTDSGVSLENVSFGSSEFYDIDQDGDLDLLLTGQTTTTSTTGMTILYINNGSGGFSNSGMTFSSGGVGQSSSKFGDVNGDGNIDLLISGYNTSGQVVSTLYSYSGAGSFNDSGVILSGTYRGASNLTDIDGDGDLDILLSGLNSSSQRTVNIYENAQPPLPVITRVSPTAAPVGSRVSIYGINFSTTPSENTVTFDNEEATVETATPNKLVVTVPAVASGFRTVSVSTTFGNYDFNPEFSVLNVQEAFFSTAREAVSQGSSISDVIAADLDLDGDLEVISATDNNSIVWHENNGAGLFSEESLVADQVEGISGLFTADLNGDGLPDIISASSSANKIAWYPNNGDGSFDEEQVISTSAQDAQDVFAADIDGDGSIDVISASSANDKIAWYSNNGSGAFGDENIVTTSANNARSIFVEDLNGNGFPDIASASFDDNKIAWYTNNGDGSFSSQKVISTNASGASDISIADLNNDGYPDLVSASTNDHKIAWYPNNGSGIFGSPGIISNTALEVETLTTGDVNGDGAIDILSSYGIGNKIAWYLNDGTGNFNDHLVTSINTSSVTDIVAADLFGDGDLDILTSSTTGNILNWHENVGTLNPSLITIGNARQTSNGEFIRIKGVVTKTLGANTSLQDGTGGIHIYVPQGFAFYDAIATGNIASGDSLEVVGELMEYNGLKEVVNLYSYNVTTRNNPLPAPAQITLTDIGESYESELIRIEGLTTDSTGSRFLNSINYEVFEPGSPSIRYILRISGSNLTELGGRYIPRQFTFEGVLKQFSTTGTDGYQLIPVYVNDIIPEEVYSISKVMPLSGVAGSRIAIHGNQFSDIASNNTVTFGSANATIISADSSKLIVEVPELNSFDTQEITISTGNNSVEYPEAFSVLKTERAYFDGYEIISPGISNPGEVYAADINGNGYEDILSTSNTNNSLYWTPNNGDGTFGDAILIDDALSGPGQVSVADLNADGISDVLIAAVNDNLVAWYSNNGDGTFGPKNVISNSTNSPQSAIATDIDQDGDLDVVIASRNDNTIAWHENNGAGNFISKVDISITSNGPYRVYAADLDEDGDIDIASASYDGDIVAWHANSGDGTSWVSSDIDLTADGAIDVTVRDLNGDNLLDIISASSLNNTIGWYSNNGDSTFSAVSVISDSAQGARNIHANDFDGDGDSDILVVSETNSELSFYENNGDGTFKSQFILSDSGFIPRAVFASDIDRDGDLDLIVSSSEGEILWFENKQIPGPTNLLASEGASSLDLTWTESIAREIAGYNVYRSNSSITEISNDLRINTELITGASFSDTSPEENNSYYYRVTAVDTLVQQESALSEELFFNYKLKTVSKLLPRMASTGQAFKIYGSNLTETASELSVTIGTTEATILSSTLNTITVTVPDLTPGVYPLHITINDTTDLPFADLFTVIENRPEESGNFMAPEILSSTLDGISSIHATDLNGDQSLDILSAQSLEASTENVVWLENAATDAFVNVSGIGATGDLGARDAISTDVNGDGIQDVIAVYDRSVNWFLNNGDGTYTATINSLIEELPSSTTYSSQQLLAFDADQDGDVDLIRAHAIDNQIVWYANNGIGSFTKQASISTGAQNVSSITADDANEDGYLDVFAAYEASDEIMVFTNNGDGTFSPAVMISNTSLSPRDIATGDLNGSGEIDLVSVSVEDSKLAWYSNSAGVYNSETIIADNITNPTKVALADLNGDSATDILVSTLSGDIYWFINEGTGTFAEPEIILSGAGQIQSLEVADVTGNGTIDILAGAYDSNELILLKNIDTPPSSPTGVAISGGIGIATLNWDANTEPDLLGYEVYKSENSIDFSSVTSTPLQNTTFVDEGLLNGKTYHYYVAAIDTNNLYSLSSDTISIAAVSTQISSFAPLSGTTGTLVRLNGVGFSATQSLNTVRFNDTEATIIDSDSESILVEVPAELSGSVSISVTSEQVEYTYPSPFLILNSNDGTFLTPTIQSGFSGSGNMATADIDSNGYMDLIIPSPLDNRISFYYSDGSNPYATSLQYPLSGGVDPTVVRTMNIYGSNYPDLIFISSLDNEFKVLKNNGGSTSTTAFLDLHTITVNHSGLKDIFPADMDNDGFSDVIIASNNDGKISWYPNESNENTVAFGAENVIASSTGNIHSIYAADFNDDNLMDLAAAKADLGEVVWFQNNGDGSFTENSIMADLQSPEKVEVADINNDGHPDILSASLGDDQINLYLNNGSGDFSFAINLSSSVADASDVIAGDVNGDGFTDVIASSFSDGAAYWFINNGDSTFSDKTIITDAFNDAIGVATYDAFGNGKLDIVVRSEADGTIGVSENFEIVRVLINELSSPADRIVQISDDLRIEFNTDLNAINNFLSQVPGTIEITNNSNEIFSPGGFSIDGNSLVIENTNLYSLDTLHISMSFVDLIEGNQGRVYFDLNQNGIRDTDDDSYISPEFYTTMIGDFNRDLTVNFDDLVLFSDGWRNSDYQYETAPLSFGGSLVFPNARLNTDSNFNIDDMVSFIRYWNYSQSSAEKAKAKELASKVNTDKEEDTNTKRIKATKQNQSSDIASDLDYISYEKLTSHNEYVEENDGIESTYLLSLSHPDSVQALAVTIEYDPKNVNVSKIKDLDLFDIHSNNSNVFISRIDSTHGVITLNVANFGALSPIEKRDIASITFKSLNDRDSEITITSDIRVKDKVAHRQVAKKAVSVTDDLPESFKVSQNYPNPFNPTTTIHYELAEQAKVTLTIYDILGRKVETLINENGVRPGYYKVNWNASRYASGMYLYVVNIRSNSGKTHTMSKKMILVK